MTYEELLDVLSGIRPDVDFKQAEDLLAKKYLTSFDVMFLAARLNDEYGVELDAADVVPENFFSAAALFRLIQTKEED